MKNIFYFLLIPLLLLCACTDDEPLSLENTRPESRAIVYLPNVSISNPDLIDDWENQTEIVLNNESGSKVTAPWADGNSSTLDYYFRKDIKEADGWMMLFHTFKEVDSDKDVNYMVFYNQFTGYLKVFYYLDAENGGSKLEWSISSSSSHFGFLDNPDIVTMPLGVSDLSTESALLRIPNATPSSTPCRGWNGFQFHVARYEADLTTEDIQIAPHESYVADFNFTGISESDISGSITSITSTKLNTVRRAATAVGDNAVASLEKIIDNIEEAKGFNTKKIKEKLNAKDYLGALEEGLKLFFSNSSHNTTTYSVSDVSLTSMGTTQTVGTMTMDVMSGGKSVTFNLLNILIYRMCLQTEVAIPDNIVVASASETASTNSSSSSSGIRFGADLGVWNVSAAPIAYYNRIGNFTPMATDFQSDGQIVEIAGAAETPEITRYEVDITFNPYLSTYLKSYTVTVDFMDVVRRDESVTGTVTNSTAQEETPVLKALPSGFYVSPNYSNKIYSDNGLSFYSLGKSQEYIYALGELESQDDISERTEYYFDWTEITGGSTTAYITVDATFSYNGKDINVVETRAYTAECMMDPLISPSSYHCPPEKFLINTIER